MKKVVYLLVAVIIGCQSPKKDIDFSFFTWNIRETYYLKMNNSDTLYYINTYPYEEQNYYSILNAEEKETIINILDSITFPNNETSFQSMVEDGKTYAFYLKRDQEEKKLKIHGRTGPKQFWLLGQKLEEIKNKQKFKPIKKTFQFKEIDSLVIAPPMPPVIN